jgi:hypothetical protein
VQFSFSPTPPHPWIASFGAFHPSNEMVVKKKLK